MAKNREAIMVGRALAMSGFGATESYKERNAKALDAAYRDLERAVDGLKRAEAAS